MPNLNRSDAQQRADDIGIFNRELARLEAEQVLCLSDSQRASVQDYQQQLLDATGPPLISITTLKPANCRWGCALRRFWAR